MSFSDWGNIVWKAIISSFIWCVVWGAGFFVLNFYMNEHAIPVATTGLVLTITVVAGHWSKFCSLLVNRDADFRDVLTRSKDGKFRGIQMDIRDIPWVRLIFFVLFTGFLFYSIVPWYKVSLSSEFDPTDTTALMKSIWANGQVCLSVFLIQAVFSWPDHSGIKKNKMSNRLPGADMKSA